jgi:DNA repair exonuclease SbcCD ATPase subunit
MKALHSAVKTGVLASVLWLATGPALPAAPEQPTPPRPPEATQRERERAERQERAALRERRAELDRQRQRLARELDRLRQDNKEAEAAVIQERLRTVEMELQELGNLNGRTPEREGGNRPRPEGRRGDPVEPEQRRQHLQVAMDHLHAAGMHEVAERLARQLESMQGRPPGEPRPDWPRGGEAGGRGMDEFRAQMHELQQQLRQLREELEALREQRR